MACATWGQRLVVHVPSRVAAGETFRLEYTVNTTDVDGRLQLGKIPDAFDVVYGPSMSQQQSYSMVNGHTSSSSTTTYTYMLMGTKNGTFTIPPAHITVGGQTISSEAVKVTVSGGNSAPSGTTFQCGRLGLLSPTTTSSSG